MLAAMLMAYAANDRQATEAPTTNASEASTAEAEPSEQVKTCLVETEFPETTQITSETQIEELIYLTELELLEINQQEEVLQAEMLAANTSTEVEAPTETEPETPIEQPQTYGGFSDADINRIASVVNGEVGSMCGNITLTYSDGSQVSVNGDTIRMMHAMVVVNQYRSAKFPSTVSGCIRTYWSPSYDNPYWQSSSKWQHCRQNVIDALNGGVYLPSNVFGATQDASFGSRYPGYWKYACVDWNTGWTSGTYYYYAYG